MLTSTAVTHSGHFALNRIESSRQSRWNTCPQEMMANSLSSGPKLDKNKWEIYKDKNEMKEDTLDQSLENGDKCHDSSVFLGYTSPFWEGVVLPLIREKVY